MTSEALERWLAAHGRAWETKDPAAPVELFTEDATYQETPFDEPMLGRAAIREYWSQVEPNQGAIGFEWKVLFVEGERASVHWKASYTNKNTGQPTRLDGIFLLHFDGQGRCRSLQEWWHADPAPAF